MNTFKHVLAVVVSATILCFGGMTPGFGLLSAKEDKRPNILFCLADDWGWPHAGAYGDPLVKTPAFDRLAREGVLFEHAYVSAPSCTASRNAIVTGQEFYRLGEGANLHSTLDVEHPNFMMLLEKAGYEIGHWRKTWGPGDFEAGGYTRHPMGPEQDFESFLEDRSGDRPFTFWLGTSDPHRPYEKGSGEGSGMDLGKVHVPAFYPDVTEVRSDIADYYYEVERWDSDVARALQLLERAGELENTIVVMTGDHGMPFPRVKGNLYDWSVRVPLALRWGAKVDARRYVKDFVSLTDLAPTFLESAGIEIPSRMTGRSLMPILMSEKNGRIEASRDFVVTGRERHTAAQEIPSEGGYPARAIRTYDYLYIKNLEPERWPAGVPQNATHPMGSFSDIDDGGTKRFMIEHADEYPQLYQLSFGRRPAEELYDVQQDPYQVNNLAEDADYQEVKRQLHERLLSYLVRTGDPRFTNRPVIFDQVPYRASYHEEAIREWYEKHGTGKDGVAYPDHADGE